MKITFLGTGPAKPVIRDEEKRSNSSILINRVLVDCTPMFLEQVKRENISQDDIHWLILTHAHKDAIGGLNDFDKWVSHPVLVFVPEGVNANRFVKEFKNLKLFPVKAGYEYNFPELKITPFRVIHYEYHPTLGKKFPTYGYRIDDLVYAEDMEEIPKNSLKYFKNANTIIADGAMWFGHQIRGHLSTDKTLELAYYFNPKNLIIIQAGRTYPSQQESETKIKETWDSIKGKSKTKIFLSYDGMKFDTENSEELADRTKGIYFVKPHAEMIWSGEKKLIIKSKDYTNMVGLPLFYLDNEFCYGILKLKEPKKINLKEFENLETQHKITEEEKEKWWNDINEFYSYEFDILDQFESPKPVSIKPGTQTFVSEVNFLSESKELSFFEDIGLIETFELQAFGSPGGKTRIVDKLLRLVPKHDTYIEAFAGGAALYWKKDPSKLDILNDLNPEIAHAYQFIKNATEEQVAKLKQLNWSPSKQLFFSLRDSTPPKDPLLRFYRFYYVLFYSYGASAKTFGYKKNRVHIFDRIMNLKEKLKDTKIYSEDYIKVLNKYDNESTFAYLDPPYPDEWPGPEGIHMFTKDDVQKLHDFLKKFKGKFLLSINNLGWIKEIFSDFDIGKIKVPRSFRHNDSPKYELLISNYKIGEIENAETGSSDIPGIPVVSGGLQPIYYVPKELIKDIKSYDATKSNNEQLVDDWRLVNAWYSTYIKTEGKGIKFSKEDIVNLAKIIYDEIVKRVEKGEMKHEFDTEKMKQHSLELYKIVSGKSIIMSEWTDLKFLENFDDFIVIKDCISLIGSTITQDHKPNDIDLLLRMNEPENKFLKRAVEVRISKMLPEDLRNKLHFVWGEKEGPHDSFIPLFDLCFKRIKPNKIITMVSKKVELLKPFSPMKPFGSAFYDLDKFLQIYEKSEPKEYSIEEKLNGFHASLHRKDNEFKIFSEQKKDLTNAFPTLIEEAQKLSNFNFAIDGELVPYDDKGKVLGRNYLMKYTGAIKSGKEIDDKNIKLHVWDITYYNEDLTNLSLKKRIEYLNKLKFSERIIEVKRKIVDSDKEDLKKAIEWASEIKGSEGAVIKDMSEPYYFGENSAWRKFRKLTPINVMVLKKVPKERGLFNYLVGAKADKKYLDSNYIIENYLVLGHTFNSKEEFEKGDKIQILIEEVWRHETKNGIHYSIHKPRVVGKTNDAVSDIDYLEDIVTSIGISIQHLWLEGNEILFSEEDLSEKSSSGEGKEIEVIDFPNRMQENFRNIIGKWDDYVMQVHTRGETLHYDIRHKTDGILEGITLFGRSINDRLKIENERNNIRSTVKTSQPPEWVKFEGITHRGGIGATKRFPGVFVIISKGKFTVHEVEDHKVVIEYKSDIGKINKKILDEAKNEGLPFAKDLPDNLIDFTGKYVWMIAHIGEHHIMLFNKLKEE